MKTVNVAMKSGSIKSYNAREGKCDVLLVLNDGTVKRDGVSRAENPNGFSCKDKAIVHSMTKDDAESQATALMNTIRDKLRMAHGEGRAESAIDSFINIRWSMDEEDLLSKMTSFIHSVQQKMRGANTKQKSYADVEREMMRFKTSFEDRKAGVAARQEQKHAAELNDDADDFDDSPKKKPLAKPRTAFDELGIGKM